MKMRRRKDTQDLLGAKGRRLRWLDAEGHLALLDELVTGDLHGLLDGLGDLEVLHDEPLA